MSSRSLYITITLLVRFLLSKAQLIHPSTAVPSASAVEIDVVFPRSNDTYNFTGTIPVVIAFQNLRAAVANGGNLTFAWDIQPLEAGLLFSSWSVDISASNIDQFTNSDGSPYLLINSTSLNTTQWQQHLDSGISNPLQITTFAWLNNCSNTAIYSEVLPFFVEVQGRAESTAPDPSYLSNVTGNCAQPGIVASVADASAPGQCTGLQSLPTASAKPCAVRLDADQVSSVSSRASVLGLAATATTTTASTSALAVTTSTEKGAAAALTAISQAAVLVPVGVFGALQLGLP